MDDIQQPSSAFAEDEDADVLDEVPDFRLLHLLTSSSHPTIPRRGEKDFEPHGTSIQQSTLDASLEAMIDTLSGMRIHLPRSHISASYDRESGQVTVENPKGPHFRTVGKSHGSGAVSLSQEEYLYLLERGSLDGQASGPYPGSDAVSCSLQQTYSTLTEIPLDSYLVYSALKRSGYIVARASESSGLRRARQRESKPVECSKPSLIGTFDRLLGRWARRRESPGVLLKPGLYRNIQDVQRLLSIIPFFDARQRDTIPALKQDGDATGHHSATPRIANSPLLQVMFHVWKPTQGFRKSAPGTPDFQMAVLGTNESSSPKLWELDRLLAETTPQIPGPSTDAKKHIYSRLRNRESSALIAVVDQGVISYIKITDAQFGRERLYAKVDRGAKDKGSTTKPKVHSSKR